MTAERFLAGRGILHRGRPLKRWRYVGVFGDQLMCCAAQVQIGPARQTFWAVHLPAAGGGRSVEREHTRLLPRRGEVELREGSPGGVLPGVLRIRDLGVELELELSEQAGIEARCPNGRSESWTRKQAGVPARGELRLDGGAPLAIDALAVIDDSAGYHARRTEWRWSAGVGHAPDGMPLAWNLVSGINDPASGSERAVWVDGVPRATRRDRARAGSRRGGASPRALVTLRSAGSCARRRREGSQSRGAGNCPWSQAAPPAAQRVLRRAHPRM